MMDQPAPPGPLEGLRVLDLTWVLSGPYAAMTLRDLGADVIKVERPPLGDVARTTGPFQNNESIYFQSINRGKRSIAIDLKQERGRALVLDLVERVDVLLENFTPGTMDRLGLGWDVLRARNPRLIYAATSGFGQSGPLRDKPALDIVIQGMGGVMALTGDPGGDPARVGFSVGDITAGLYTVIGVLAALRERERSGLGQAVDISMLDCQIAVLENAVARYFATGEEPRRLGHRHPTSTPFQAFPTADGWMVLALAWGVEHQWELLCSALDRVDLIHDPRFNTPHKRTRNHAVLEPELLRETRTQTTQHWIDVLEPYGIPIGPLNTVSQAVAMEQIAERGMIVAVEHPVAGTVRLSGSPLRLSRTPGAVRGAAPLVGQHTRDVLHDLLALDAAAIDALVAAGIVATEGGPDIAAYLEA